MKSLTVLYDAECGLCARCKMWTQHQPSYFTVKFIDKDSSAAADKYPELIRDGAPQELLAIGDQGEVYRNDKAWLMVLYATRRYRKLALLLARPGMAGMARRAYAWVSRNRGSLSKRFGLLSEREVRDVLDSAPEPMRCDSSVVRGLKRINAAQTATDVEHEAEQASPV